jgi:hypothetical protein
MLMISRTSILSKARSKLKKALHQAVFNNLDIKVEQYLPLYKRVLDLMHKLKQIGA